MSDNNLRKYAADFVHYKRSLDNLYNGQEYLINRYVSFAETTDNTSHVPAKETVKEFLKFLSNSPGTLYQAVSVLREFSRYLQACGFADAYVMSPKMVSQPTPEAPYFFTEREVESFFEKIDSVKPNCSFKGREIVLPVLFRLLYCCGMRCKEARKLLYENVHAEEGYIDIIQSKGPKSRRIFISKELADYLIDYDNHIRVIFPDREYYFPNGIGHYSSQFISSNFKRFWLEAFPGSKLTTRPRAYDFR